MTKTMTMTKLVDWTLTLTETHVIDTLLIMHLLWWDREGDGMCPKLSHASIRFNQFFKVYLLEEIVAVIGTGTLDFSGY